jgi:hypothetical protein
VFDETTSARVLLRCNRPQLSWASMRLTQDKKAPSWSCDLGGAQE